MLVVCPAHDTPFIKMCSVNNLSKDFNGFKSTVSPLLHGVRFEGRLLQFPLESPEYFGSRPIKQGHPAVKFLLRGFPSALHAVFAVTFSPTFKGLKVSSEQYSKLEYVLGCLRMFEGLNLSIHNSNKLPSLQIFFFLSVGPRSRFRSYHLTTHLELEEVLSHCSHS